MSKRSYEFGNSDEGEIPEGWMQTTLARVGEIVTGTTPSRSDTANYGQTYPWVKPPDLGQDHPITETKEYLSEAGAAKARLMPTGSVMVSCIGSLGKTGIAGKRLATNQQINSIVFDERLVEPAYGYRYCQTLKVWLEDNASATTIPIVNKTRMSQAPFLLPPTAEQRRIGSKIEKLLTLVNTVTEQLVRIPDILKRFRQAVLAAACSGRLTADWRTEKNSEQPAASLLNEIQTEVLSGKKGAKHTRPVQIDDAPYDLPESWSWASTSDMCTTITDGDHQPPPKAEHGIPFVVISNLSSGVLDLSDTMFVPDNYYQDLSRERRPIRGDILYSVTGSYGIAVLVDTDDKFCFQRHIALLRPHHRISSKFFWIAMSSAFVYRQSSSIATGIAQMTVPLSGLRALRIPVPPSNEESEIVRRVDSLFKLADAIEKRVAAATARVEKLTQAILAKAFRGELVPTEAELARRDGRSYESATALLERIRPESMNSAGSLGGRNHKSQRKRQWQTSSTQKTK